MTPGLDALSGLSSIYGLLSVETKEEQELNWLLRRKCIGGECRQLVLHRFTDQRIQNSFGQNTQKWGMRCKVEEILSKSTGRRKPPVQAREGKNRGKK